jgi:hypothetical protein
MVRACLPGAAEDVVARVQRTADGVPFLVEEVLASPGVPASFLETVRARLSALDDAERVVLGAAAVLGRHFDWRLLGRISGEPPDVVASALERGVEQVLLSVHDGEFRFRHALTKEATVTAVLPPRRTALAASALAALEDAHPGLPGQYRRAQPAAAESGGSPGGLRAGPGHRAGTGTPVLVAAGAARAGHDRAVQPQRDGPAPPGPPAGGRARRDEHRGRPGPAARRRGRRPV